MYPSYVPYIKKGITFNLRLKIRHKGQNWKQISNIITNIKRDVRPTLEQFAREAAVTMANIIDRNRKRRKLVRGDSLANYFRDKTNNIIGVRSYRDKLLLGIGRMDELRSRFPYWAALNYGSSHMVGKYVATGYFMQTGRRPSGKRQHIDRWTLTPRGYTFKVTKPIVGIHYIEKTQDYLMPKWKEIWLKYWADRKNLRKGRYKI